MKKQLINERKQLMKTAGLLNEDFDYDVPPGANSGDTDADNITGGDAIAEGNELLSKAMAYAKRAGAFENLIIQTIDILSKPEKSEWSTDEWAKYLDKRYNQILKDTPDAKSAFK